MPTLKHRPSLGSVALRLLAFGFLSITGIAPAHLAEAHLKNGDRELAIKHYRRALQIDPKFTSSVEALKELVP